MQTLCKEEDTCSDSSWAVVDAFEGRELRTMPRFRDEDSCSDASWVHAQGDCETCSDISWACVRTFEGTCNDDMCDSDYGDLPRKALRGFVQKRLPPPRDAAYPADMSFIGLVSSRNWNAALSLLLAAPDPVELAKQRDSYGDSALSWAVYKSTRGSTACLSLICRLLLLSPSDVWHRSKNHRFLPLHEAAWGKASSAIATLLCAAYLPALQDSAPGQTPHQVGCYYSSRHSPFSWPSQDMMHANAEKIQAESEWLQSLAALQLPPGDQIRSLSWQEFQATYGMCQPLGELLADFFDQPQAAVPLPSIREQSDGVVHRRRGGRAAPTHGRQRPPRGRVLRCASESESLDEVDCFHEPCAKQGGLCAGAERSRHSRCTFTHLMVVADGAGIVHRLALHAVHGDVGSKGHKTEKWPSKKSSRRDRTWEREEKTYNRQIHEIASLFLAAAGA